MTTTTFIFLLFASSCPAAISRFVIAIIVYAVERFSCGSLAHVVNEIGKYLPSFANSDASTAVVFKVWCFIPSASLNHRLPRIVGRGCGHPMDFGAIFILMATTADFIASLKVFRVCLGDFSTIAKTLKTYSAPMIWNSVKHDKMPESLACKIFKTGHRSWYPAPCVEAM